MTTNAKLLLLLLATWTDAFVPVVVPPSSTTTSSTTQWASSQQKQQQEELVVDVVVVGAGMGGLCCAGLCAKYGLETICVESHDAAGGVAHSFDRFGSQTNNVPFRFDSGPSLLSGMSQEKDSTNPLRQVLDALEVSVDWKTYDGWMVHDQADGRSFKVATGDQGMFEEQLEQKSGKETRRQFESFKNHILQPKGIAEISAYIPPMALRSGLSNIASLFDYWLPFLSIGTKGLSLTGPFSKLLDDNNVDDPFVRKWFDYLAFALSGLDASHTQAAAVAYMMMDLHKPGAVLDYPMGGMDALIQALVTGLQQHNGTLLLDSRVDQFLLDNQAQCHGVRLHDGRVIRTRKGVVCNAPLWNMARILQDSKTDAPIVQERIEAVQDRANQMTMTGSFMHLHLGIPKDGLPDNLECHHSVLDFSKDVTAEQNMVIISIPTVFDPSLAPEGYHIVHAYTAACDNFEDWQAFLPDQKESGKVGESPNAGASSIYARSNEYQTLKEEKAQVLWRAIECVIPDVRERAKRKGSVSLIGTPLTHRRYNQRYKGTYGPSHAPGRDVWELPGATTEIKGLFACGDTTFPGALIVCLLFLELLFKTKQNSHCSLFLTYVLGIGLPGVAASGTIAANTLTSVAKQRQLMAELREKGALQ